MERGADGRLHDRYDPMQAIGAAMRLARRRLRLSQRELAALLGVDRAVVGRWESGSASPAVAQLDSVLRVLGFRLAVIPMDPGEWGSVEDHPPCVADRGRRRFPAHLDAGPDRESFLNRWGRHRDVPNPFAPGWGYTMDPARRAQVRAWLRLMADDASGGAAIDATDRPPC